MLCIFIGLFPVLVNLYFATTAWSWGVASKVCSVFSQVSWADAELTHKQKIKGNNLIWKISILMAETATEGKEAQIVSLAMGDVGEASRFASS